MLSLTRRDVLAAFTLGLAACGEPVESSSVRLLRVPQQGRQPRVVIADGTIHLLFYRGEDAAGDLFYTRSTDDGATFAEPLRVNSQPASAIASGTIRGGQMAIGQGGRIHVAWNGSAQGQPKGLLNPAQDDDSPNNGTPFLYAYSDGEAFTPQRNLMQQTFALDGGGAIGADNEGRVYAAWHGSSWDDPEGEAGRRLWLARSMDNGETFGAERPVSDPAQGACGCCSAHLYIGDGGQVAAIYRTARELENRDAFLLSSTNYGETFQSKRLQPWKIAACPMSSAAFSNGPSGLFAAWETAGQVWFAPIDLTTGETASEPVAAPGTGANRKHPSLAQNAKGELLLAWIDVPGWGKEGTLHWQAFDSAGAVVEQGGTPGVPIWSFGTGALLANGSFAVLY